MNKKTILITGSGSGLGRKTSLALAKRGHKVYATTQFLSESINLNKIAQNENLDLISFKLDILMEEDRRLVDDLDII